MESFCANGKFYNPSSHNEKTLHNYIKTAPIVFFQLHLARNLTVRQTRKLLHLPPIQWKGITDLQQPGALHTFTWDIILETVEFFESLDWGNIPITSKMEIFFKELSFQSLLGILQFLLNDEAFTVDKIKSYFVFGKLTDYFRLFVYGSFTGLLVEQKKTFSPFLQKYNLK